MKYIKRIFTTIIGVAIWFLPAYYYGEGWLFITWLPALFVMMYLED